MTNLKRVLFILLLLNLILFIINNQILIENNNFKQIYSSMFNITITKEILNNVISSILNTFIFAYLGLGFGVMLAMIFTYFSVKYRKLRVGKVFSIFFNSQHELIIVLVLSIVWGINSFVAIFAIALAFSGVMSKVFTSNIDNLEDDNFINYQNKGYTFATNMLFNIFPKSFSINVDYIAYRFECALRSTVVLSYVGIVGIGFYINLALNDSNYNLVFTYVYSLIIFMMVISYLVTKLRKVINKNIFRSTVIYISSVIVLFIIYVNINYIEFNSLFSNARFESLTNSIINVITFKSNIYNDTFKNEIIKYTLQTIRMGLISTTILIILVNIYMYYLSLSKKYNNKYLIHITNFINLVLRSIPELVLLSILLFIFKPNIFAGALAIALHNFGIVSKLLNAQFIKHEEKIALAYQKNYSALTVLVFVISPILSKYLFSTYVYRYEVAIKNSVVIGLLGSGGLGYLFKLKLSAFNYDAVIFICIVYIVLFILNDLIYNFIKSK